MKLIKCIIPIILILFSISAVSQEKVRDWTLNGYAKDMQTILFNDVEENWMTDNLIHNRMNFNWYPKDWLKVNVEMRNRFIWGEMLSLESILPDSLLLFRYSDFINQENGLLDISDNLIKGNSFLLHSTLDRFYFDITKGNLQARIGRQRINWGQTMVWNPNDLFNNYSFFDFDYEEKPGSDAVKLQYYTSETSQLEFAVKANHQEKITAAALYRFNKWNYDIQILGGLLNEEDYVIGAGWSGQLFKGGLRGEMSYFQPKKDFEDTTGILVTSIGYDYTFKNSLMLQAEVLYNSNGRTNQGFNLQEFYYNPLSAKNLSLNELTFFAMASYPVTPLVNASLSGMYSPSDESVFIGPSVDLSVSQNFDISVNGQVFFSDQSVANGGKGAFIFIRFKRSF